MLIHGFNKTTLLDYPGIVACTLFTGACNFRCPFCQNADLVLNPASQPVIPEEEILAHLSKRKGITRGVCITGGEPTINGDLEEFIEKLKSMDLKIKLDTNGYRPEVTGKLFKRGLVDYVAMDIKSSFTRYSEAAGTDIDIERIRESIAVIMSEAPDYEFRTTVVKELHDMDVFEEISVMLKGAEKYYLQAFVDSERVISGGLHAYSKSEMEKFVAFLRKSINFVDIRGIE